MTLEQIMQELESYGNEGTVKIYTKHGMKEPMFGVKVADLKKILKKTKKDHELSTALYDTGNYDAMYLAGLMADEEKVTKKQLEDWVKKAYCYTLSEYTVPWLASESKHGFALGQKWIKSKKENIAASGWATLASLTGVTEDEDLDLDFYKELLDSIPAQIHDAPNRVRYTMNGFVISVGSNVKELTEHAQEIAEKIGKVSVFMGNTACKVPLATDYIQKIIDKNRIGKKRKTARC